MVQSLMDVFAQRRRLSHFRRPNRGSVPYIVSALIPLNDLDPEIDQEVNMLIL